ncbi:hypothetical protein BsIDN1_68510 [Bacillus safensis]|uniref:Phosphotransferase system EIIC domain-containing protein n=1 Tax=Bacillus safensis TaxID=561879 RepID=A0A5S9MJH6_BACIA|nr:hypothetical protein BsIDN1_68510 [Bacillus safensis]
MSFKEKAADVMGHVAYRITNQKYIMAIKQAFVTLMPIIITGAFAVLVANMIMSPETGLAHFEIFRFLAELQPIMKAINYATLNFFLTIGAVFLIGIELGKINGHKSLFPGLMALISFYLLFQRHFFLKSMDRCVRLLTCWQDNFLIQKAYF